MIGNANPFSWGRIVRRYIRNPGVRFIFWWRIASYLFQKNGKRCKKTAHKINRKLISRYGTEIELGAKISPGITFAHYQGIVISRACIIGKNFHIRQNTTIGVKTGENARIIIGDNVELGANCCIIADDITIGNNVKIGAMAFINKSIPDNCLCYTTHSLSLSTQSAESVSPCAATAQS